MDRRIRISLWLLVIIALALAGCSGGASPQPSGGDTAATSAPAGGSGSGGGASGSQVVVTAADAGKTVQMKVGQQLLVKLGTDKPWKVDVTPSFLLATVDSTKLNDGEQGLYEAKMKGQATVQATAGPGSQFNINIVITN